MGAPLGEQLQSLNHVHSNAICHTHVMKALRNGKVSDGLGEHNCRCSQLVVRCVDEKLILLVLDLWFVAIDNIRVLVPATTAATILLPNRRVCLVATC